MEHNGRVDPTAAASFLRYFACGEQGVVVESDKLAVHQGHSVLEVQSGEHIVGAVGEGSLALGVYGIQVGCGRSGQAAGDEGEVVGFEDVVEGREVCLA